MKQKYWPLMRLTAGIGREPRRGTPDDTHLDELLHAHARRRVAEQRLREHGLCRGIHPRRDEADRIARDDLAVGIEDLRLQPDAQIRCLVYRHLDVSLEPGLVVDGG